MRRRLIIYIGVFLTVVMFALHYITGRYLVSRFEHWDYKEPKGPYGIRRIIFDEEGRMRSIALMPKGDVEVMGVKANDTLDDVIRKIGKPQILRSEKIYEHNYQLGKEVEAKIATYKVGKGGMVLEFVNNRLREIYFARGNPRLPLGLKMGMNKEEVKKILGPPTESRTGTEVIYYRFYFLDILVQCFWGALLYSWVRRWKFKPKWFHIFPIACIIFLFVQIVITFLGPFLLESAFIEFRSSLAGIPLLLLPLHLPISILIGAMAVYLEYNPFQKRPKRVLLNIFLISLGLSFLLLSYFLFYHFRTQPFISVYSLFVFGNFFLYFLFFSLFFYLLCPPTTPSLYPPKISILNILIAKLSNLALKMREISKTIRENIGKISLVFVSSAFLLILDRILFSLSDKLSERVLQPLKLGCIFNPIIYAFLLAFPLLGITATVHSLWEKGTKKIFYLALQLWLTLFSPLLLLALTSPFDVSQTNKEVYSFIGGQLFFLLCGFIGGLALFGTDFPRRWLWGWVLGFSAYFYGALVGSIKGLQVPFDVPFILIISVPTSFGGALAGFLADRLKDYN